MGWFNHQLADLSGDPKDPKTQGPEDVEGDVRSGFFWSKNCFGLVKDELLHIFCLDGWVFKQKDMFFFVCGFCRGV